MFSSLVSDVFTQKNNVCAFIKMFLIKKVVIFGNVGLSNILDSMGMQKFRRRQPMKRTHRHIIRAS
jgi:hypothetical protein